MWKQPILNSSHSFYGKETVGGSVLSLSVSFFFGLRKWEIGLRSLFEDDSTRFPDNRNNAKEICLSSLKLGIYAEKVSRFQPWIGRTNRTIENGGIYSTKGLFDPGTVHVTRSFTTLLQSDGHIFRDGWIGPLSCVNQSCSVALTMFDPINAGQFAIL